VNGDERELSRIQFTAKLSFYPSLKSPNDDWYDLTTTIQGSHWLALSGKSEMTGFKILTFFLTTAITISAHASRLTIPDSFEFLAIDGSKFETALFVHTDHIELNEGRHKITLRYRDTVMDLDQGYEVVIKSKPFTVSLTAEPGMDYRLEPKASGLVDKHAFANQPEVVIHDVPTGDDDTLQPSQNKPVPAGLALVTTPESPKNKAATAIQTEREAAKQLRYWWSRADLDTRQSFMSWVIEQRP
jgi:uncharacterized protein YccT (UPF0319 family)